MIKKGAGRLNRIASARRKVYHCPACRAGIAFEGLGEPPVGIKVRPAVPESGGACSDLVVCPKRNLAMILLFLWLGGISGGGMASCVASF